MKKTILSLSLLALLASQAAWAEPLVIAHRGASGYLPEHTMESTTLAFALGADFIEQDVVISKDGVPVVLHDIHLDTVTNVADKYPQRKRDDGRFYALDFTLTELKSLKVHERSTTDGKQIFKNRYQGNAEFTIATFEEQIELINQLNRQFGKNIGFYPEIKSPAWHREQGVDISKIVMKTLRKHSLDDASKAIYVQCFDYAELKRLRHELGAKVKLIQLLGENDWGESPTDYDALRTSEKLEELATIAQGIGPWIPQLVDMQTLQPTGLVKRAHDAGLDVHPYTFRQDALPKGVTNKQTLDLLFKQLKVDGLFTDFTDTVVTYLDQQPR
ncbi:glycerophosphoryl diester phosphodiesterase [Paraglaciecola sp. T6c]|uniref:glycerophosphodiester phosphodiesterase n=1 Tax=Pseudoalteromonas atlantica (strain T6c / ATCC BAA-1087) TaxID=3042615 RepID=UPI00005C6BBC|nr:glycerophosphodiester phosphodiesterase [Paraglaciecola sp. T6c]ABG39926.1 glycerophosphoryl diester phosphodiesterase [Paraglaciecola sp. T6c]